MQRHHRSAASRVGLGTLIAGIALSLVAFGMSPAQASAASAKVPAAAKQAHRTDGSSVRERRHVPDRHALRRLRTTTVLRRWLWLSAALRVLEPVGAAVPHQRQQVDRAGCTLRRRCRDRMPRGRRHCGTCGAVAHEPGRHLPDKQGQTAGAVLPHPTGGRMCRLMVVDAPVRRMLTVLSIFLPIGVVFSIWRGDSFGPPRICPSALGLLAPWGPAPIRRSATLTEPRPRVPAPTAGSVRVRGAARRVTTLVSETALDAGSADACDGQPGSWRSRAEEARSPSSKIAGPPHGAGDLPFRSLGDRGAGGNRTRVLERRTRSSPGAVNEGVFSAPALALTRRRRAQSGKSPGHIS